MITIPTVLISCIIGALYDKVTDYISILGGFCSVVIGFLMPGLLYVKTSNEPFSSPKNLSTLIIITVLCLTGFTAGIMTIVEIINKPKS